MVAKRLVAFGVLFTANASANLTIIGGGTQWRMQRADCAFILAAYGHATEVAHRVLVLADMNKTLYNHSEYRCGLAIVGVDGFYISDVTISDTGGDGCT